MNISPCRKLLPAVQVLVVLCASFSIAAPEPYPEHEVKAAFLYNFMLFTEWPNEKVQDANKPVAIFIVGKYPRCKTFEEIQKKSIEDRPVEVRQFDSYDKIGDPNVLRQCHILLVCESEKKNVHKLLDAVKGSGVLTVGEFDGFLEAGGIINFVKDEEKIRFEISLASAEAEGVKLRSKLLRLAKRVIKQDTQG
jgi:hypothetical protein